MLSPWRGDQLPVRGVVHRGQQLHRGRLLLQQRKRSDDPRRVLGRQYVDDPGHAHPLQEGQSATGGVLHAPGRCTAVGSYLGPGGGGVPLVEHSSAGAWRVQPIQAPSGTTDANLAGISCTAAACRTAVGDYPTGPGNARLYLPLAEYWDGSTWRLQATASPAGHKILGGSSCTSAGSCTAVGWYRLSPTRRWPSGASRR